MPTKSASPSPAIGLAVLARRAEVGRGKTRLAATVGARRAFDVYRRLIALTAEAVRDSGLPAVVCFDPAPGDADVWGGGDFGEVLQPDSPNLGDRIAAAIASAASPAGALVIGTDCPTLTGAVLVEAADSLAEYDAVLGPSHDGGFYLLGLRSLPPDLLGDVAWSTDAVAEQVRAAFRQNGWRWCELPVLRDIDTEADWDAYLAQLPSPQSDSP